MPDDHAHPVPSGQSSATRLYAAVMLVGVGCAVIITTVYETTEPIISRNRIERRQDAIFDVLPAARRTTSFRFGSDRFEIQIGNEQSDDLVFAGYDEQGQLVGVAIEAEGKGYQDIVRVIYGYSIDDQSVIGLRVLQSRETPGLGDRVETDTTFRKNFERLDVTVTSDGAELINEIEFVKRGDKQSAWQIDGISGATITSKAIAEMLRASTATWVPRIFRHRSAFEGSNAEAAASGDVDGR